MTSPNPKQLIELLKKDHRFTLESYRFVNESLEFAQKMERETESENPVLCKCGSRKNAHHISGQDLCYAVRDNALEQFGFMARTVLAGLGIRKTGDIGDIVFNLININYMQKTDEDTREDFDNVFDLSRSLEEGFSFKN